MTRFPTSLDKLLELAKGTPYEQAATEERRRHERAERDDSEDLFRGGVLKRRKR